MLFPHMVIIMKSVCYAIYGIITLALIPLTSIAYSDELTYEEKLLFSSEKEQIIGHIISAIDSIQNEDYDVAKMHLMHPLAINFPKIESIISIHDKQIDQIEYGQMGKLELVLTSLTFVEPKDNFELLQYKLVPIFQILVNAEEKIVGKQLKQDPIFQLKLIRILLEESTKQYQEYLELDNSVSKTTKKQDSFSLAIKSHMILSSIQNIDLDKRIKNDFENLFFLYQNEIDKIPEIENNIIYKINIMITDNSQISSDSKQSIKPTIILKKIQYSSNNVLMELHGENFEKNQTITIEYISPISDLSETIKGKTTSQGTIHFPLEFSQDMSSPYVFSIISGDITLYEILIPQ